MIKHISFIFLIAATASCAMSFDDWEGTANFVDFNQSEPAGEEQLLKASVELGVGQMEIGPGSAEFAYEVELHFNESAFRPQVEFERENGRARLKVGLEGEGPAFRKMGENRLNLRLNPQTPLELEASTGVGESTIDLSGMQVRSLSLECGVGQTNLSITQPNQTECGRVEVTSGVGEMELIGLGNLSFREFEFQGGVGGSTLDFSGNWDTLGEVEIEVGVGGIEILIPRDIGIEIRVSKSFFSEISMPGFDKQGDTYYSDNIDQVEKIVKFNVSAGIGEVEIKWI